ncbi:MAG: N-acetylneuraminate synthase family protein, partial [bacterium]|nr:N-acetylneuraminate synthase family protein [bacterium]
MKSVQIGKKSVGAGHPAFIIAELGINANGSVELAKKLIDVAVKAGADAVKFQKRTVDVVFSSEELNKPREVPREFLESAMKRGVLPEESVKRLTTSDFKDTRNGDQKYALEFSHSEYGEIDVYCREHNILWSASPWDEASVDFLSQFDVPFYKVASASLTDDELLKHMRSKGKPVVLSTGGSTMDQIHHAVGVLGRENLVILHCTAAYPKAESDRVLSVINLDCIHTLSREFPDIPIGFSGNDSGRVPAFAAVAMGAVMLEKHLTLNREMWGSDQASSIEPNDFTELCEWTRVLHIARGDGIKTVYPEEVEVMKKLR